jgi:lipoyl(octanoyl) transferase
MPSSMTSVKARAAAVREQPLTVKHLGRVAYEPAWREMQAFTRGRTATTTDELWLVEHPPVYTMGLAARAAHLPRKHHEIPIVQIDRGGQITYHGPGQVLGYLLLYMKRRHLTVRRLVRVMETAVIDLLADYGIRAGNRIEAPGVYVEGAKIAAVGLRITRGCCYHGLALNVDMDLSPFFAIDPCGYPGLAVTQLKDLGVSDSAQRVSHKLARHLERLLA